MSSAEQPQAAPAPSGDSIPAATTADLEAPEVVAVNVARVGTTIDRWALVSIYLGLAFTMVNVQQFAAAGAEPWTLPWLAAWLLDPMVSILLLVVVRAEQITARWQVGLGWKVTAAKWVFFAATYVMNTWASWRDLVPSLIVLHSIPPVLVLIGAEVLPVLREGLTEAVLMARRYAEAAAAAAVPVAAALPTVATSAEACHAPGPSSAETVQDGPHHADRPAPPERPPDRSVPTTAGPDRDEEEVDPVGHLDEGDRSAPASHAAGPRTMPVDEHPACGPTPLAEGGSGGARPRTGRASTPAHRGSSAPFGPQPYDVPLELDVPTPAPADVDDDRAACTVDGRLDSDDDGEPDPVTGDDLDARVVLLTELLRETPDLSGPAAEAALKAAQFQPMSGRTARRLLGKARDVAAMAPPPAALSELGPTTASTDEQAATGTAPDRQSALSLVRHQSTASTSKDY